MVDVVAVTDMTFGGKIPFGEVYLTSSFVCFFFFFVYLFCLFFLLLTLRDVKVTCDRRFFLIQKVEIAIVSSLSY